MRPRTTVAAAALTAAVAVVALPGLAGSRTPSPPPILDQAAFETVLVKATRSRSSVPVGPLDAADRSAGFVDASATFVEPAVARKAPPTRPRVTQPATSAGVAVKPPRYTIRGYASFYDNGTTAMRLPRGTIVRICGAGGCVERVVNDYGPSAAIHPERVVDMMRSDFFAVCGCGWWSGTTYVTVGIY